MLLYQLNIRRWYNAVGIKNDKVVSRSAFHAIVAGLASARIWLKIIMNIKLFAKLLAHLFTTQRRTVFNNQNFKIGMGLFGQTFQQFFDFIRAVINRNDNGQMQFFVVNHWIIPFLLCNNSSSLF